MKKSTKLTVRSIAAVFTVCVLWTFTLSLISCTIISRWLSFSIETGLAVLAFPAILFWQKNFKTAKKAIITLIYFSTAIPLAITLMLGINKFTNTHDRSEVTAKVTSKHTRQQSDYRTVGRRHIYKGSHNNYYVTLTLPDGFNKEYQISPSAYAATHRGSNVKVFLHRGCFGFETIDSTSLRIR